MTIGDSILKDRFKTKRSIPPWISTEPHRLIVISKSIIRFAAPISDPMTLWRHEAPALSQACVGNLCASGHAAMHFLRSARPYATGRGRSATLITLRELVAEARALTSGLHQGHVTRSEASTSCSLLDQEGPALHAASIKIIAQRGDKHRTYQVLGETNMNSE